MFPLDALMATKKAIGSYWWTSLYQQEPTEEEGSIFKRNWFKYFSEEWVTGEIFYALHTSEGTRRIAKNKCWIFQTCDPAASTDESGDYFALGTFAVTPSGELLVLDMYREHASTVRHEAIMMEQYSKWKPKFQGVENKTFGLNIINACKKKLPIKALVADKDKVSRSLTISVRYEAGMVFHKMGAAYVEDLETELMDFPVGTHDDQVDVMSYGGICFVEKQTATSKGVSIIGQATDWNSSLYKG
jgi:predicted phage terminase large subunit-like protein